MEQLKDDFIVNAEQKSTETWEFSPSEGEVPAHLEFRRIVATEFAEEPKPQPVGFHYREHSAHLIRRAGVS